MFIQAVVDQVHADHGLAYAHALFSRICGGSILLLSLCSPPREKTLGNFLRFQQRSDKFTADKDVLIFFEAVCPVRNPARRLQVCGKLCQVLILLLLELPLEVLFVRTAGHSGWIERWPNEIRLF